MDDLSARIQELLQLTKHLASENHQLRCSLAGVEAQKEELSRLRLTVRKMEEQKRADDAVIQKLVQQKHIIRTRLQRLLKRIQDQEAQHTHV